MVSDQELDDFSGDDAGLLHSSTSSLGNLRAVAIAFVAGIGPLIFGFCLGFTSPSLLPMEVGAAGDWARRSTVVLRHSLHHAGWRW